MHQSRSVSAGMCCLAAIAILASPAISPRLHAQGKYTIEPLPLLPNKNVGPGAINDSGHVVGYTFDLGTFASRAFLYRDGVLTELPTLGGEAGTASGINIHGDIAGSSEDGDGHTRAFLYRNGVLTDLGTLGAGLHAMATDINDEGVVVGQSRTVDSIPPGGGTWTAFLWDEGSMVSLGSLLGGTSEAGSINNSGVVAGVTRSVSGTQAKAFRWEGGTMTSLGQIGPDESADSRGGYINAAGAITGNAEEPGTGDWHPFIHQNGTLTDLGFAGSASGINDSGHVVGQHDDGYPFLYAAGSIIDINTLIDPGLGWELQTVSDINNRGQIIGEGAIEGVYRAFILTPPELNVTRPLPGERWVAGEPDTIRWHSPVPRIHRLFYSVDDGATYQDIADVGESDTFHVWYPPDDIRSSSECRIKIRAVLDSDSAVSGRFTLRAVDLVRELSDGKLDPFYPTEHSWHYDNGDANTLWPESWWDQFDYVNGYDYDLPGDYPDEASLGFRFRAKSGFPDWPLYVQVVTRPHAYVESLSGLFDDDYNSETVRIWGLRSTPWSGSCYGLSMTALLQFGHKSEISAEFPEMAGITHLPSTAINNDIRRVINLFQNYTLSPRVENWVGFAKAMTPRQTLEQLRLWLLSESRDDDRALVIESQSTASSHAVLPYIVERKQGSPGVFTIYLYDPNQPLNNSATIEIDSAANTWKDLTPLNYGSGQTGCYPTLQSWMHLRTLAPDADPVQAVNLPRLQASPVASPIPVVVPPAGDVTIVDAAGDTVGFRDGRVVRGIDSATVFIIPTGGFSPPGKYLLPAGEYLAVLDRFTDTTATIAIGRDSVFYSYRRTDADSGQRDILTIGDGVGFVNPDAAEKRVDWKVVFTGDSVQTTFDLEDVVQPAGDSLAISGAAGAVRIGGGFAGRTYDLKVKRSSPGGTVRFFSPRVALAAGATHEIVPADDGLSSVVLRIDENSDGVADDSVSMDNELTAVADGRGADIPADFALRPNYPNPFNPSTTVRYDVPERSRVSLKVFDVLGREVATLVDRVEEPGPKQVVWDAGDRPAGVYYLRMSAEEFVATAKMLLVK